ncbi:MAG TPA: phosphoribosyltransferase [Desulfomonilia bacterium]|nr:phosphoribosyltransferase [Desulfomonilia bacterium]
MNDQNLFKKHFPQVIRLSWEDVEDLLWKIFIDMKEAGYDPDVVIGVARGGLAPARILMDYLQKKYICTFQMGHWEGEAALSEKPRMVFPLPDVDLTGKRVLVVDDVSDEGGTMEEVLSYLAPRVKEVRTAVLVNKADSRLKADFCSKTMSEWRWVMFPWTKHEDLLSFTEKVLQLTGGASIEDIIRILQEAMGVEIARNEIEQVLSDMNIAREVAEDNHKVWTLI